MNPRRVVALAKNPAADDDVFNFVNPFDQPASPPATAETTGPEAVSRERAECEKTTREEIDAHRALRQDSVI